MNDEVLKILNTHGITFEVLNHAKKMNFNIISIINEKIINNYNTENLNAVVRNILGVYGNFIATIYCKKFYEKVENEVPVFDSEKRQVTKADICFIDKLNNKNYVEVKTVSQIIDNIRNYVDSEEKELGNFEDKDNEILKYKYIGKKLITQVDKLKKTNCKVWVIVFDGCIIDDIIKSSLKQRDVNIMVISPNVNELEEEIRNSLIEIHNIKTKKVR